MNQWTWFQITLGFELSVGISPELDSNLSLKKIPVCSANVKTFTTVLGEKKHLNVYHDKSII